jgi:uncharacterized HAD superfamily protein
MVNMQEKEKLDQTWFIDIDGTIFKHRTNDELDDWVTNIKRSYLKEEILEGVQDWFSKLSKKDKVIFVTAREERHREHTLKALKKFKIKFDQIIFGVNAGPRIIINDLKPKHSTGLGYTLKTAKAINVKRDEGFEGLSTCHV